jgi:hypothetical protein
MAKESGLSWTTLSVDDSGSTARAIKNDITNFQFATPRGVQDVTGVDKAAYERILLLADFSITLNGVFNDTADTSAHAVFSTVPSTSVARLVTLTVSGQLLDNANSDGGVYCLFTDYPLTRSASGELTFAVPGVLSDGSVPTWGTP